MSFLRGRRGPGEGRTKSNMTIALWYIVRLDSILCISRRYLPHSLTSIGVQDGQTLRFFVLGRKEEQKYKMYDTSSLALFILCPMRSIIIRTQYDIGGTFIRFFYSSWSLFISYAAMVICLSCFMYRAKR